MIHRAAAAVDAELWEDPAVSSAAAGQARARREGAEFDELAYAFVENAGGTLMLTRHKVGPVTVDARIRGRNGGEFWLLAHGNVDADSPGRQPGLRRTDTVRKAASSAAVLQRQIDALPVLLLTSHMPTIVEQAAIQWLEAFRYCIFDVISIYGDLAGFHRLHHYLNSTPVPSSPQPADWMDRSCTQDTQLALTNREGSSDA